MTEIAEAEVASIGTTAIAPSVSIEVTEIFVQDNNGPIEPFVVITIADISPLRDVSSNPFWRDLTIKSLNEHSTMFHHVSKHFFEDNCYCWNVALACFKSNGIT